MRGRRLVAASYSIAKQLPLEVGLHQDDFSNEKSVLTALTSSFALLAFSKYRRAQITPNIDLYCIIRFIYWFLQFFTSPDFASIGLRHPIFGPILPKSSLSFWFLQSLFVIILLYSVTAFGLCPATIACPVIKHITIPTTATTAQNWCFFSMLKSPFLLNQYPELLCRGSVDGCSFNYYFQINMLAYFC